MSLYHYLIGFPKYGIKQIPEIIIAEMSYHAKKEANCDRVGGSLDEYLPYYNEEELFIETKQFKLIEMECENRLLKKLVLRKNITNFLDLVIVVEIKQSGGWGVKTVWSNEKTDDHKTINLSPYEVPEMVNNVNKKFIVAARVYEVVENNGRRQFLGFSPWEPIKEFSTPMEAWNFVKEHQRWPLQDGRYYSDRDLELQVIVS